MFYENVKNSDKAGCISFCLLKVKGTYSEQNSKTVQNNYLDDLLYKYLDDDVVLTSFWKILEQPKAEQREPVIVFYCHLTYTQLAHVVKMLH